MRICQEGRKTSTRLVVVVGVFSRATGISVGPLAVVAAIIAIVIAVVIVRRRRLLLVSSVVLCVVSAVVPRC